MFKLTPAFTSLTSYPQRDVSQLHPLDITDLFIIINNILHVHNFHYHFTHSSYSPRSHDRVIPGLPVCLFVCT